MISIVLDSYAVFHSRKVFIDTNWFWFHEYPNKSTSQISPLIRKEHIKFSMKKIWNVWYPGVLCFRVYLFNKIHGVLNLLHSFSFLLCCFYIFCLYNFYLSLIKYFVWFFFRFPDPESVCISMLAFANIVRLTYVT